MFRRWGVVALIAGASVVGVAGVAVACGIDAYCPTGPRVDAHVSNSRGGYVRSNSFRTPAGNVSVPSIVVPIPQPGPIGPLGDDAITADATASANTGSISVGPAHFRAPGVGDVSVPSIVVPIPQPGPIGPIGDVGRVVYVVQQKVNDLLPSRDVGGVTGGGILPNLPGPPAQTHG